MLTERLKLLVASWRSSANEEAAKRTIDAVGVAAGIRGCIVDLERVMAASAAPAELGHSWEVALAKRYEIEESLVRDLFEEFTAINKISATSADYQVVLDGHKRLVRELDVLLNGQAGAAEQASLCDIVSQVRREEIRSPQYRGNSAAPAMENTTTVKSLALLQEAIDCMEARSIDDCDFVRNARALLASAAPAEGRETRHVNDNTKPDPDCEAAILKRDAQQPQGIDPYWAWGFRAGWAEGSASATNGLNDDERTAIEHAAALLWNYRRIEVRGTIDLLRKLLSRATAPTKNADARRMRTLCRLLDAMDDLGNGFPGDVHAAFQDGAKTTRAALDRHAIPADDEFQVG